MGAEARTGFILPSISAVMSQERPWGDGFKGKRRKGEMGRPRTEPASPAGTGFPRLSGWRFVSPPEQWFQLASREEELLQDSLLPPQPRVGSVFFRPLLKGGSTAVTSLVPFRPACLPALGFRGHCPPSLGLGAGSQPRWGPAAGKLSRPAAAAMSTLRGASRLPCSPGGAAKTHPPGT